MARATWTLLAVGLLLAGCGRFSTPNAPVADEEAPGVAYGDYLIGEPIRYQNLTVFPVSSAVAKTDDRFITLDEGLKAGTVEIRERGGGSTARNILSHLPVNPRLNLNDIPNRVAPPPPPSGQQPPDQQRQEPAKTQPQQAPAQVQPPAELSNDGGGASVNEVSVINRSDKPLYLTPGDVMIGGQQDRVIGQEVVVEASGKATTVPVFCVERRRWSQRDVAQNVDYLANVQARDGEKLSTEELQKLAQEANGGKFVKGAGVVTKDVRLAVQGEMNQDKVWDEVAKANGKSGAKPGSGAFTANYGEKEIAEKLNPYLDALEQPVAESHNVIGVIVAVAGKPHSIDVFESTPLFQKLWPKLLKSYALDALGHGETDGDKTCDTDAAVDFLRQASEAKVAKQGEKAGVSLTHRENDKLACFTVCKPVYEGKPGDAAPAKTAPAPIHLNALSK
jgi:hypothetical protein